MTTQVPTPDDVFVRQGFVEGTGAPYKIKVDNVPGTLTRIADSLRPKSSTYSDALLQLADTVGKVQRGDSVQKRQLPSSGFIDELVGEAFPFGHDGSDFTVIAVRDYMGAALRIMYDLPKEHHQEWIL